MVLWLAGVVMGKSHDIVGCSVPVWGTETSATDWWHQNQKRGGLASRQIVGTVACEQGCPEEVVPGCCCCCC